MEIRHLPAKEYVINHSFYSKELIKKKKRIDEWQQQKKRVNDNQVSRGEDKYLFKCEDFRFCSVSSLLLDCFLVLKSHTGLVNK